MVATEKVAGVGKSMVGIEETRGAPLVITAVGRVRALVKALEGNLVKVPVSHALVKVPVSHDPAKVPVSHALVGAPDRVPASVHHGPVGTKSVQIRSKGERCAKTANRNVSSRNPELLSRSVRRIPAE